MRAFLGCIALLLALSVIDRPDAGAISKRRQCKAVCGAAIDQCVQQGGKKRKCRRQTLKKCRKQGIEACVVTVTSTTVRGGTTLPGGSTTTIAGGATTTNPGGTTTTHPGGTTTTTLGDTVHGCSRANATDLKASGSPVVVFKNYQYVPRCILISAGQTVTFSGDATGCGGQCDFSFHPLVGGQAVGAFKTPDPASPIGSTNSGTSKPVLFDSAGIFPFYCDNHGLSLAMTGAVFVDP
jgi:plastocyanin